MSSSHSVPRLVVLISGAGTNLQALIDATQGGRLSAHIVGVVANRAGAYGLARARAAGIATSVLSLAPFRGRDGGREGGREGGRAEYDAALADEIKRLQPDLIVLAGWMHIFGPAFVARFAGRMINLHPALPGTFPGAHAIADAYAAFARGEIATGGCMVHEVTDTLDTGRVIAQASVPILPGDTLASFEERMHAAEHDLIVAAVDLKLAELGFAPDGAGSPSTMAHPADQLPQEETSHDR